MVEYKNSMFNYYTEKENGELLLYNSYVGVKSFIKVKKESVIDVKAILNCQETIIENQCKFPELIEKGYLIPKYENEQIKLKKLYLDVVDKSQLELTICPTEDCNFRCKYCYESFNHSEMSEETKNKVIKFVKKNINKYTGLTVSWFGGEPLFAKNTVYDLSAKFIDICKQSRKIYSAGITTNGYYLDIETFQKLHNLNVLYYQVTLDGIKCTHDQQRVTASGGETFDVIVENLQNISKNILSNTFTISLRTNFSKNLTKRLDEYLEFYNTNFASDKRFKFFVRPVMDWGGEIVKDFKENLLEENKITYVYDAIINSDVSMIFNYETFLEPGGTVCYAAKKNSYIIDAIANVYKCTCDFNNSQKIGYIDDNGNMVLDEYKNAMWICDSSNCNNTQCFFRASCLGESCPARRVLNNLSSNCPIEKENIDGTLKLLENKNNSFSIII